MKHDFYSCMCNTPEHSIIFSYDLEDPTDKWIYINVQMKSYMNIFQRTIEAIKYIFGYNGKCGHWDGTMLDPSQVKKLKKLLEKFEGDLK